MFLVRDWGDEIDWPSNSLSSMLRRCSGEGTSSSWSPAVGQLKGQGNGERGSGHRSGADGRLETLSVAAVKLDQVFEGLSHSRLLLLRNNSPIFARLIRITRNVKADRSLSSLSHLSYRFPRTIPFDFLYVIAILWGGVLLAITVRRFCFQSEPFLTEEEWIVTFKLILALGLFVILFLRLLYQDLAAEAFIYGRF